MFPCCSETRHSVFSQFGHMVVTLLTEMVELRGSLPCPRSYNDWYAFLYSTQHSECFWSGFDLMPRFDPDSLPTLLKLDSSFSARPHLNNLSITLDPLELSP